MSKCHCWKSHALAHMLFLQQCDKGSNGPAGLGPTSVFHNILPFGFDFSKWNATRCWFMFIVRVLKETNVIKTMTIIVVHGCNLSRLATHDIRCCLIQNILFRRVVKRRLYVGEHLVSHLLTIAITLNGRVCLKSECFYLTFRLL